jgi:hypothetical protein
MKKLMLLAFLMPFCLAGRAFTRSQQEKDSVVVFVESIVTSTPFSKSAYAHHFLIGLGKNQAKANLFNAIVIAQADKRGICISATPMPNGVEYRITNDFSKTVILYYLSYKPVWVAPSDLTYLSKGCNDSIQNCKMYCSPLITLRTKADSSFSGSYADIKFLANFVADLIFLGTVIPKNISDQLAIYLNTENRRLLFISEIKNRGLEVIYGGGGKHISLVYYLPDEIMEKYQIRYDAKNLSPFDMYTELRE